MLRRVNVTAASEAEFDMRIDELKKRGFEVHKILPVERPEHREVSYDSTKRGTRNRQQSYVGFAKYRAVMQKEFEEVTT